MMPPSFIKELLLRLRAFLT